MIDRDPPNPLRAEARLAGLGSVDAPSLEQVERRRLELWVTVFIVAVGLAISVVLLTITGPNVQDFGENLLKRPIFRVGVVVFPLAVGCFVAEKERHLRRMTKLLIDERVLNVALSNRIRELSTLHEVGKAVNSVLALDDVLHIILSSAVELLRGSSGSIMLLESPDELRVVWEIGNQAARGARVHVGDGIAGEVAKTRQPALVGGHGDGPRSDGVESAVCVPLVNRDELLGVLSTNGAADRVFNAYDLRALSLFAEHAAAAINNATLYETERHHVAELVALDEMKSEFVATVSHELRTPLTSILGSAQTLQRPELPTEVSQELGAMIERQGNRLLGLIEDVLDLQRTASTETVDHAPLDIGELLREVAHIESSAGRQVELQAPQRTQVLGDHDALVRVFTNLIDNGFEHGGGDVQVRAQPVEGGGRRAVHVAVLDRGPGIPKADDEKIFERFVRGTSAHAPGLGLGLSMVKTLIEAQGGRVWASNREDGGAAFHVLLPALPPSPAQLLDPAVLGA